MRNGKRALALALARAKGGLMAAAALALGGFGVLGAALGAHAQQAPTATVNAANAPMRISADMFGCIRKLQPVRGFYVGNLLGQSAEAIAAAEAKTGRYPVGTVIQLVPTEAMVKREAGFNPATNDWEFFELDVSAQATAIRVRGAGDVVNRFGGNCLSCHAQAKPEFDMVCEQTNGCAPIPITPLMAKAIQNTDPRCETMSLPDDQVAALKALAAFAAARPSP